MDQNTSTQADRRDPRTPVSLSAVTGISHTVSWAQLALGAWLFSGLAPDDRATARVSATRRNTEVKSHVPHSQQ